MSLVISILAMVGPMFTVAILLVFAVSTIVSTVVSTVLFLSLIDLHQVGTKVVQWYLAVVQITHGRPSDVSFHGHPRAEIFCQLENILASHALSCHSFEFSCTGKMT